MIGDDLYRLANSLLIAGYVAQGTDPNSTPNYHARYQNLAVTSGGPLWMAQASAQAGLSHVHSGRPREALRFFEDCLRLCEDTRTTARTLALQGVTIAATMLGEEAEPNVVRDALRELHEQNSWLTVWQTIEHLGVHWIRTGRLAPGAVVIGHLEAHGRANLLYVTARAEAVAILGAHPEMADAQVQGAAMTRDQLVAYILNQLGDQTEGCD